MIEYLITIIKFIMAKVPPTKYELCFSKISADIRIGRKYGSIFAYFSFLMFEKNVYFSRNIPII